MSMTITIDLSVVHVACDPLGDASAEEIQAVIDLIHDLRIHVDPHLGSGRTESAFRVG
jgi:hypothetical protein